MKRSAWVAGLLGVLLPGLGQTYNGQVRKGLFFYCLLILTGLTSVFLFLYLPGAPLNVLLPVALFFTVWVYVIGEAALNARRISDRFEHRIYNRWYIYLATILLSGLVVQPLVERTAKDRVAEAYQIPTGAMEPTLLPGDYLLVSKRSYRREGPARAALVVFEAPDESGKVYVKRAVGLPGDTLQMRDKALYVNGRPVEEPYVQHLDRLDGFPVPGMLWQRDYLVQGTERAEYWPTRDDWGPLVVPPGHYFVLGDNRDDSEDSRYYGFVPEQNLIGAPKRLYFSWEPGTHEVRWDRIGLGVR